jgi:hypothetical protein
MFATGDWTSWALQCVALEFGSLVFGLIWVVHTTRRKLYMQALFIFSNVILPTFTGTLSSLPQYLLVCAPWFVPVKPAYRFIQWGLGVIIGVWLYVQYAQGLFVG